MKKSGWKGDSITMEGSYWKANCAAGWVANQEFKIHARDGWIGDSLRRNTLKLKLVRLKPCTDYCNYIFKKIFGKFDINTNIS